MTGTGVSRRAFLASLAGAGAGAVAGGSGRAAGAANASILSRPIPATGERLPAIGLGTWITFNVGDDAARRDQCAAVMQRFFDLGGGMIDSSPMYGTSEAVIGYGLRRVETHDRLFAATKVWTWRTGAGPEQMSDSLRLWELERFDLMQVHNLLSWEGHLETLFADKAEGRTRYVGVTTSHGRRHDELERIMTTHPIDFVQLTYNILDREAERRLLPLAAERGIAVIANRPFRQKQLIHRYADHPLPAWASEFDCENWPQFLLKFIIGHPAVTCAIPATSRVDHVTENMGALRGLMPDAGVRKRMVEYVQRL